MMRAAWTWCSAGVLLVASVISSCGTPEGGQDRLPTEDTDATSSVAASTNHPGSETTRLNGGGIESPAGSNGSGPAVVSPIRVPLPTNEISGSLYEIARTDTLKKLEEVCGQDHCGVTVDRSDRGDPIDDWPCDKVDSAEGSVDTDGDGLDDTVIVERGGTIYLIVNRSCPDPITTSSPTPTTSRTPTTNPLQTTTPGS